MCEDVLYFRLSFIFLIRFQRFSSICTNAAHRKSTSLSPPPPSLMCGLTADSPRRRRACCCTSSSPGKHCRGTTQSFYTADSSSARPSERRLRNQYRGSARARRVVMGSLCFTEAFFFPPRTNSLNGAAEYFNTNRLLIAPTVMIRLIPSSSKFGHFCYLPRGKHCSCAILKLKKKEEGHRC